MELLRLKLRGAIGLREGCGLEEIDLNLSGLNGMIALDGDNGRGKTTVLDNLQPYRFLPSRKKKSLQHHFYLKDSFRDLCLEYKGHRYRFLIKIDPDRNKQEGFVYVDGAGESVVTGKATEYDRFVENLFGSAELFMSSVFCAQKTDDSTMSAGDMKKQYAEFLRLNELQAYAETSKRCEGIVLGTVSAIEKRIENEQHKAFGLSNAHDELRSTQEDINLLTETICASKTRIGNLEKLIDGLRTEATENQVRKERARAIDDELSRLNDQLGELKDRHEAQEKEIQNQIAEARFSIEECKSVLFYKEKIQAAGELVKEFDGKLSKMDDEQEKIAKAISDCNSKIGQALNDERKLVLSIDSETSELTDKARLITDRINSLSAKISELNNALAYITNDADVSILITKITVCKEKLGELDRRDPACQSTSCSFIVGALVAEKKIGELESELSAKNQELSERESNIRFELAAVQTKKSEVLAGHESVVEALRQLRIKKEAARNATADDIKAIKSDRETKEKRQGEISKEKRAMLADLGKAKVMAAKLPGLQVAQAKTMSLQSIVDRELEKLSKSVVAFEKKRAEINATIDDAKKRRADIGINPRIDEDLNAAALNLRDAKDRAAKNDEQVSSLRVRAAGLERDVQAFDAATKEIAALTARRDALTADASEWAYLKAALGKDGLQALEIDSVAPVISSIANNLLSSTFGPSFQVRLDTLSESNKETLEVWVTRENGTEVLLDDLSGGEKVWVLKALRLARTVIAKEKSRNEFCTAFGDEEDGALRHGETSENFIGLYRAFLKLAGFTSCFYISHKPECIAMADHLISFEDGAVVVS